MKPPNTRKIGEHQRFINLNVRGLSRSATLEINERSKALVAAGRNIYKLGLGQSPFPVPAAVVEALQLHAGEKDYLPVMGLPELRTAVALFHKNAESIDYTADDVLIGPGSKELMFIVQLVYYGDLVIPSPSWVSYAPQAQIIGRQIRWLATPGGQSLRMSVQELEKHCSLDPECPRLVILNYPNNPSGETYSKKELREIAGVARRYRVILLSDEIYGPLHFEGRHVSIARYYPEGTIISSGLSKWCGAGGWRLGTFTFPKNLHWLRDAMAIVASETYTATAAPIQYAAVTAYQGGSEIDKYLRESRIVLKALAEYLYRRFLAAQIILPRPAGAFYLFLNFERFREQLRQREIVDSLQLCEVLLSETGIAILPGSVFGRPPAELSARISFVDFDGEKALRIVAGGRSDDNDQFCRKVAPRIVAAADLLVNWLENLGSTGS